MAKAVDVGLEYAPATQHTTQGGYWVHVTANGVVVGAPCQMIGFYVNSTNAGVIQLFDNATVAANPLGGLITPAIGFQWFPAILLNGLFASIGGTALDVTFFVIR